MTTAPSRTPDAPAEAASGRPGLLMLAALLGLFCALLDITVVNVALPTIGTELKAGLTGLEWVANAYLLALAVFIVTAGRLGDVYGRRTVYTVGVAVFMVGSLVCGLAGNLGVPVLSDLGVLHAGRVLQGLGAAVIMPLSLAIIYAGFTGKQRAMGLALWGAVGGLATALGPLIGGILVTHVNWESIFLLNLPLGAVVIVAALRGLPAPAARHASPHLDVPGLVTVGAALLCLNLALINGEGWGWTSPRILALFAGAVAGTVLFLAVEARSGDPILTLAWFRRPGFSAVAVAGLLMGVGTFSLIFFLSIYLQNGLGLSAVATGVRLLPMTVIIIPGAIAGGRLAAKLGERLGLAVVFALMAVGLGLFLLLDTTAEAGSWTSLLPGMLVTGFALGAAMPLVSDVTIATAPAQQTGVASSLGTMFRQIGNSIGIAVMGALLQQKLDGGLGTGPVRLAEATRQMALFALVVTVVAVAVLLAFFPGRLQRSDAEPAAEVAAV